MRIRLALAGAVFCALTSPLLHAHDPKSPSSDTFAALAKSMATMSQSDFYVVVQRAKAKDPRAQLLLAIAYRDGLIISREPSKYIPLVTSAAELGYAPAQTELASQYAKNGEWEQAVRWYQKAIAQDEADAEFDLGLMYAKGEVPPENKADMNKAIPFFRKAAAQDHAQAEYILAMAYREGSGVDRNEAESKKWMLASATHGFSRAQFSLGAILYLASDFKNSLAWFERAAEQKHSRAELNVASMYLRGEGTPKDSEQALYWYKRAAEHGEISALPMITSLSGTQTAVPSHGTLATAKP
jgi:hypothetical protein